MRSGSRRILPFLTTAVLAFGLVLGGCGSGEGPDAASEEELARDGERAGAGSGEPLEDLRVAVGPFRDFQHALAAGYDEPITPCWYHGELGAMGYHYANLARLEDPTARLLQPEAMMYEPGPDGEMEFVGIEYIVPIDAWEGEEPPTLLGEVFRTNEELGVYVLHVWLGKENPRGLFADWNPDVTCDHAEESEDRG
jgi:hypothetical protein